MRNPRFAIAAGIIMLAAAPLMAHHSFAAEFDHEKPITLKGAVTKVDWVNPHVYIYVDVKGENGEVTNWALENNSPNSLVREGWTRHALQPGDEVTVDGFLAKDGSKLLNAQSVKLPNGKKVFSGQGNYPKQ